MVHDPAGITQPNQRLAPIGVQIGYYDPPVPRPERYDVRYVDGHIIYDTFTPMYERLGGMRYVGKPLTEIHFNPEHRRYEQYFENVGFYVREGEGPEQVKLFAYGAWQCPANCRSSRTGEGIPKTPIKIAPQFSEAVERLGPHLTGFARSEANHTSDGYVEQVFDNVVLIADPVQPSRVFLRPIAKDLGISPEPLVGPKDDPEFTFFPIQGEDLGYNVPKGFVEFIAEHGGWEASGKPIGERVSWGSNVYRQCFENLCLLELLDGPEYFRIHPDQLGYQYTQQSAQPLSIPQVNSPVQDAGSQTQSSEQAYSTPTETVPAGIIPTQPSVSSASQSNGTSQSSGQINIQVWEVAPMVAPNQNQEIGVSIYENNAPMIGIEPDITVFLPDGSSRGYYMYPTGEDGQTRMLIEPIQAPSGTLIPYEVCVFFPGGQKLCVKDTFVIWDNP
jgi:hypothetical protein